MRAAAVGAALIALWLVPPAAGAVAPGSALAGVCALAGLAPERCALAEAQDAAAADPRAWGSPAQARRGIARAWRAAARRPAPAPGVPGAGASVPGSPTAPPYLLQPAPPERVVEDPNADPLRALGGGESASPWPLGHYMFDVRIDTGLDDVTGNFFAVFQQALLGPVWMALVYLLRLVMRGLELSFELNLLSEAMAEARAYLERARAAVTEPWLLAAISAAGLWAIWRGLVQGRIAQSAGGLGLTVLLMAGGLYLISDPAGTLGAAGAAVDEGAAEIFAALSGRPGSENALAEAERGLFEGVVTPAWCALQFADVSFCREGGIPGGTPHRDREGFSSPASPAALFLRWPANGEERTAIYESWRDGGGRHARAVAQMQKEATGTRVVMIALIALGLLGAIVLFGLVAFRLVAYSLLALVLFMLTPVMLLVAALGDSGRRAVAGWARWLIGSLVGKLIYAVLLAVLVLATNLIAGLELGGFVGTWLLLAALWWMAIVHRNRLAEWLSAGAIGEGMRGGALRALSGAYLGGRLLGTVGHAGAVPLTSARRGLDRARASRAVGVRAAAERGLDTHAERSLAERLRRDRTLLAEHATDERELTGVRRALEPAEQARLRGGASPLPPDDEGRLRHRAAILETRSAARGPAAERARANVRRVADNHAREGREWTPDDLTAERGRLARADEGRGATGGPERAREQAARAHGVGRPGRRSPAAGEPSPGELVDAGLSETTYRAAPPALRARMLEGARSREAERRLLGASAPENPDERPSGAGARRVLGERELQSSWAEARRAQRAELRARRARRRIYRAPRV